MNTLLKDIAGGMGPPQEKPWWVGAGPTVLATGLIILFVLFLVILLIIAIKNDKS